MEKIFVEIQQGGITANSLNPLSHPGEEPYVPFYPPFGMSDEEFYWERERAQDKLNEWHQMVQEYEAAEAERVVYRIKTEPLHGIVDKTTGDVHYFDSGIKYKPGTIYEAVIIEKDLIRII